MQDFGFATAINDIPREDPIDDELAVFPFIQKDALALELDLFATKWFDYRHLTPWQATRLYIDQYQVVYRRVYARHFDRERAEHIKVLTLDDVIEGIKNPLDAKRYTKSKRMLSAGWSGRQMADLMGIPYEIYIELAFEFRLRFWNQSYLPQPQHLYNERDVERIQERWEEMQASLLYVSQHPAYNTANYCGAAYQHDYHEWLFRQAEYRPDPAYLLAGFVKNEQLTLEKIECRVAPEIFERVKREL